MIDAVAFHVMEDDLGYRKEFRLRLLSLKGILGFGNVSCNHDQLDIAGEILDNMIMDATIVIDNITEEVEFYEEKFRIKAEEAKSAKAAKKKKVAKAKVK